MPEIKRLEATTDWIAYEFDGTPFLAEQTIRLRLRFLDNIEAAEEYVRNGLRSPRATANLALAAVAAWDLTEGGKPIPLTEQNKAVYLRPLLGELLKKEATEEEATEGEEKQSGPRMFLARKIVEDAAHSENFLKN